VQRNGELNYTEVWAQVTTGLSYFSNQEVSDFRRQLVELGGTQSVQVAGGGN
jgi:hypothetical protein